MDIRIFVEKKPGFQTEAQAVSDDLKKNLAQNISGLRLIDIYDILNIENDLIDDAIATVFSDSISDDVAFHIDLSGKKYLAYEYRPGQYDLEADVAAQLLKFKNPMTAAVVKRGKLLMFEGDVDLEKIKKYYINPIETREKDLSKLEDYINPVPAPVGYIADFFVKTAAAIKKEYALALTPADIKMIQDYFQKENRLPTETELLFFEAYWSDHCRHTTFLTELIIDIQDKDIKKSYESYQEVRKTVGREKGPQSLMDLATVNMAYEKYRGNLNDLEESTEKNACSIYVDVDIDGEPEKWLLLFKNETHNHPTEIEPFGGASTCIGGAIRDPLSGRGYVYQALRVTGSGDIRLPLGDALPGKLPQRMISQKAALGYSLYGNQIGVAAPYIREIYHPGYVAKRMEVGAVIAACPLAAVRREEPVPGDIVLMLGGRTGRDGIGAAAGSSKAHDEFSLEQAAAEVQKGNPLEERKLQRLFRNSEAVKLIKKANDFGAGGISVAVGELSPGIKICLDAILVKYSGLSATELALSESQERMAVVVSAHDKDQFIRLAREEAVEAVAVATVIAEQKLIMTYRDETVLSIERTFLDTNGAKQQMAAKIPAVNYSLYPEKKLSGTLKDKILQTLSDLNVCSQKGLTEMFDGTVGAGTVLAPYGGRYQATPTQGAVGKLPVLNGETKTCSIMTFGYNPELASFSPYHGAQAAVLSAVAKVVAIGGDYRKIRFSFQEYFEKLENDPIKWGKPVSALLGAFIALKELGLASIGGKDSMSGSFKNLNVPPALIALAVVTENSERIITPEFKEAGNYLYYVKPRYNERYLCEIANLKHCYMQIYDNIGLKRIISAFALETGGLSEAIVKMAMGNRMGVDITTSEDLFAYAYGGIVVESREYLDDSDFVYLGTITDGSIRINGTTVSHEAAALALKTLVPIYPEIGSEVKVDLSFSQDCSQKVLSAQNKSQVNVLVPVLPGTNSDYDIASAFFKCGARVQTAVFNTLNSDLICQSITNIKEAIDRTDIVVFAGGTSVAAKYMANLLINPYIKDAILKLLQRQGLILGIGSGFQALVKTGLLPFGDYGSGHSALVCNEINRHVAKIVKTRVASVKSPWLSSFNVGDIYNVAVSTEEGKYVISHDMAALLFAGGQVAFQYCDLSNQPTMNPYYNPTGSYYAIEGIVSPDGLILGKMGHSERYGNNTIKNIYGNNNQDIFQNAIDYFKREMR
ncbi:MAG: phosphoribosylformylglycinamidine synthase [Bacilli bacterium]|nr:phosphoribosylformylglycinamidine synthase [Bacilli bacterium]